MARPGQEVITGYKTGGGGNATKGDLKAQGLKNADKNAAEVVGDAIGAHVKEEREPTEKERAEINRKKAEDFHHGGS